MVQALAYNIWWKWFYHHYYAPLTCSWNHFTKVNCSLSRGLIWTSNWWCVGAGLGLYRCLSFGGVLSLVPTKMARKKPVEGQLIVMTSQVENNKPSQYTNKPYSVESRDKRKKLIFFGQITTQICGE